MGPQIVAELWRFLFAGMADVQYMHTCVLLVTIAICDSYRDTSGSAIPAVRAS